MSDALDAVTKLITEAQRLKAALDEAEERLSQEIANAAHAGAKAVAQRAKDELDAVIGPLKDHLDDLITAVQDLPDHPDDPSSVRDAALALVGDLDKLLDAIGLPGVPAAVRVRAREARRRR